MAKDETTLGATPNPGAQIGGDWRDAALCRTATHFDWFPGVRFHVGSINYEKIRGVLAAVCDQCPVATDCLEDALNAPARQDVYGVRAGTSPKDRAALRRRRF